jgi:muconolactone delta-isomerase
MAGAGVLFPVDDRDALHRIIAELPPAAPARR